MGNTIIIPARSGSKRILQKNVRNFCGKPIIGWSIELALKSPMVERVIVSTDDHNISEISKSFGAEVPFSRPSELADDFTSVIDVVRHAIESLSFEGSDENLVTLLYATAPLTRLTDMKLALKSIDNYDFCASVAEYPYPLQRALGIAEDNVTLEMLYKENFYVRSQDLNRTFYDAGQFIVGKAKSWLEETPFISGKTFPIVIPDKFVQDIDFEDDWAKAESKFKALK